MENERIRQNLNQANNKIFELNQEIKAVQVILIVQYVSFGVKCSIYVLILSMVLNILLVKVVIIKKIALSKFITNLDICKLNIVSIIF